MKVVIVGAGPSGLVTCKSLLEAATPDFPFDPIIFEQENSLGGTFHFRTYEVCEVLDIHILSQQLNSHIEREPRLFKTVDMLLRFSVAIRASRSFDP